MNATFDGRRNLVADLIAGLMVGIAWLEQDASSPDGLSEPRG